MSTLGPQGGGFGAEAGGGVVDWIVVPPDVAERSPPATAPPGHAVCPSVSAETSVSGSA